MLSDNNLNEVDIYNLTKSQSFGILIKDDIWDKEFLTEVRKDCDKIIGSTEDLLDTNFEHKYLRRANFGQLLVTSDPSIRGDLTIWLTPDLCKQLELIAIPNYMQKIIRLLKPLRQLLSLNGDYSAQLAAYPGNGSRYVKHLDAGRNPQSEKSSARKLTTILYLNEDPQGGELRAFNPTAKGEIADYIDIKPSYGRLVMFRSDLVEHEVLPSASTRIAITIWASSDVTVSPITSSITRPIDIITQPKSLSQPYQPPMLAYDASNLSTEHQWLVDEGSIFVSIAAYRDSECKHTIHHLFSTAKNRNRIFVGVLWQAHVDAAVDGVAVDRAYLSHLGVNEDQVRILHMDYQAARGPCYARHIVDRLRQDERYLLQIDSHMRFREHWDSYLICELEHCRHHSEYRRPILTSYPLAYELPSSISKDIRPTLLVPQRFDKDGMLRQSAKVLRGDYHQPIRSPLWASGFSIADSSIFDEVPYDPQLLFLFFGEEMSMAARLFTHGYDFFAPATAVVYHLWQRSYRPVFQEVPHPHRQQLHASSIQRVQRLLSMHRSVDDSMFNATTTYMYGLGNRRSLSEFEAMTGIHIQDCVLLEGATEAKPLHPDGINFATSTTSSSTSLFAELLAENVHVHATSPQPPHGIHAIASSLIGTGNANDMRAMDASKMLQLVKQFL